MNDTHPEAAKYFRDLMKSKSNEERLRMGCSMYDTARQIVMSAVRDRNPEITPEQMKREVFLRFYGADFNETQREKILRGL